MAGETEPKDTHTHTHGPQSPEEAEPKATGAKWVIKSSQLSSLPSGCRGVKATTGWPPASHGAIKTFQTHP